MLNNSNATKPLTVQLSRIDDEYSDNEQASMDFLDFVEHDQHQLAISPITISSTDSEGSSKSNVNDKMNYKFRDSIPFDSKKQYKLWSVEFNNYLKPNEPNIFAVTSGPYCMIFKTTSHGTIELVTGFEDPDPDEDFYTCCWSLSTFTQKSVLLAAGARGIIRIFHPEDPNIEAQLLIGHGSAINQLKISSRQTFLLASASSDQSIRLWNIDNGHCIAIFYGFDTHKSDVVTIDFNHDCGKLISGGIDHTIVIWDLSNPQIVSAIEKSVAHGSQHPAKFKTLYHPFSVFRSRDIHCNYIDCVKWHGDFIISKSINDDLICWQPGFVLPCDQDARKSKNGFTIMAALDVSDCGFYFMRFAMNSDQTILALGNNHGEIRLYNLDVSQPNQIHYVSLKHSKHRATVRDISFSRCGRDLVVGNTNGTICLYQRKMNEVELYP